MHGFDALNPPFDRLTHAEVEQLRAAIDIGYFAPGSIIVERGGSSEFLHVVIKGSVAEKNGDDTEALLGPKDTFDSEAVVHGSANASFVAVEETLCYLLPRLLILQLVQKIRPSQPSSIQSSPAASMPSRHTAIPAASIRCCASGYRKPGASTRYLSMAV